MGDLITLSERLPRDLRPVPPLAVGGSVPPLGASSRPAERTEFFFDLADPISYLLAEQVERVLGEVDWLPVDGAPWARDAAGATASRARHRAGRLASRWRLPLVWPEQPGKPLLEAQRAAAYAVERGAGARFVLAASRLAFCGGYDLREPRILAEAAAAAGLSPRACLVAAADPGRDKVLRAATQVLMDRGITRLPAIRLGRNIFSGDQALAQAAAVQAAERGTAV